MNQKFNHNHNERNGDKQPLELTRRGEITAWVAGLTLVAAGVFGVGKAYDNYAPPKFSKEAVTKTVEPGDTLWEIASRVEGSDKYDTRYVVEKIENMPENAKTFEDDVLDQGEKVTYPESVE